MRRVLHVSVVPAALVLTVTCLPLLVAAGLSGTGSPMAPPASVAGINPRVLTAYQAADGWCTGLRWQLLAGIGWVESRHATAGGASVDETTGEVAPPILGPPLEHTHAAQEPALGPMQLLPAAFARWVADGDGDGATDPHDIDDAVATGANYLCGGRDGAITNERAALRRYNDDASYVDKVISYADSLARNTTIGDAWLCPVAGPTSFTDTWLAPRSGGRQHHGVDMFATTGTPVVAPVAGVVEHFDDDLGGLSFRLWGDDGNYYFGTHLSRFGRADGHVVAGTIVGYVGSTGNATVTGAHLHFEIHPGRHPGDPAGPVNPAPIVTAHCPTDRFGIGIRRRDADIERILRPMPSRSDSLGLPAPLGTRSNPHARAASIRTGRPPWTSGRSCLTPIVV